MDKYISADKFRAMMYHEAFEEDSDLQRWDSGCWIRYKMFRNVLEQIEPADVQEVRHGRWINYDSDSEIYDDIKCSNCGRRFTVDSERHYDIGFVVSDLRYCPYCGASMVDEVDE